MNNDKLIHLLEILRDSSDGYRSRAFDAAKIAISSLTYDVASNMARFRREITNKEVRGIGKGILERIEEFAQTGTIIEADNSINESNALSELTSIKGVGKKTAQTWIKRGIYNLADVRRSVGKKEIELTLAQKYGVLYYYDLLERIPRREIDEYSQYLRQSLAHLKLRHFDIVGSYRRGAQSSGDVDILVDLARIDAHTIDAVEQAISNEYYLATLSKGEHSITYLYKYASKARQCDILLTSGTTSYVAALIYFTGSKEHGIALRRQAKKMNMTLNQYGLFRGDKKIALKNERDLYIKLGMEYVEPEKR